MFGWFQQKSDEQVWSPNSPRAAYNVLDATKRQFLGRCVSAIKQAGIRARGTRSFSVLLGEAEAAELRLDPYWSEFCNSENANVFAEVVEAARKVVSRPPTVKDVLVFQSDAFSLEPPLSERGLRYDLPLGDDIAAYVKERLESKNVAWKLDDPVQEDYGAVLLLYRGKNVFSITTSWQGENAWALVFGQMRGCLGWFFDWKPNAQARQAIEEIKLLVSEVVVSDSERFQNPTWIADDEFPGVAQNFVIPDERGGQRQAKL
jgi:hypothetical protein